MFSQKYGSRPIQLISINSFGKILLHAEAVTFLRTLAAPISLASIIGPSQTGKSFLMQQIVSQGGQFNQGATAGLWVWSKPMLAYNQEGRIASILLVDSQGFGLQRKKNDQTLIGILLLLANCLLYNSIGPIDSVSFSELQEVMTVARQLKDKSCEFHWILRDFDPTLVDSLGTGITGRQYMENQLMTADSFAQTTVQSLRQSFPSRSCHCFVKPAPSAIEQPPQFLKQVIQLRKCLNGVPSVNLEGSAFVAVVQAYIDSFNAGDSLSKASEQGRDCRMRLQCLQRLGQELRSLEQRQSCNQIQDLQEQLGDIRTQLKEYYKQRMCSHRQIQILDQQLNEIIQDFQEINEPARTTVPSREVIRLNVPKPDKMVRISLNISQSDKDRIDFDSRARLDSHANLPLTSIGRINTDKNLHNKMEEYQAKIYRYELEAGCSRKELEGLKDEYDQSRRELDVKTDQLEQLIERTALRERQYQAKIQRLEQQLQDIKKAKLMVESQLAKVKVLNEEKVTYLQEQLNELAQQRQLQLRLKEQKYRVKLAQCLKENQDLKKSHDEQLAHLKKLYQQSHEQLVDSRQQQSTETFYKEMRQQMQQLQTLKELLERQRFGSGQREQNIASLYKQLQSKQQANRQALEQASKRAKDGQKHLKQMFQTKLSVKEQIIQDLQQRIKDMTSHIQSRLDQLISQNNRLLAELEQKERKLTLFSNASQEDSRQIGKLKQIIQEYEQAFQVLNQKLTKKEQQRIELQTKRDELASNHQQLTIRSEIKEKQLQQITFQVAELKGEVSILQQTHEIEVSHLKQQYQTQISQLRQLFESQKQRLQVRLKEAQNSAEIGRRIRQDYENLQHQSAQTEFQLRQMLDERDRQLDSAKDCLRQSTQQCEQLTRKNNQLLASLMKVRAQAIDNCEQAAESQRIMKEQLQSNIDRVNQANSQKLRIIAMLKQQLQREEKTSASKIQSYHKSIEQMQIKLKNHQIQYSKQNMKLKEQLQTFQKKQIDLIQQVALLTHKLTLQEQILIYKADSKNAQITKLAQKVKNLQSKYAQTNNISANYQQQLKEEQQQVARLQSLLSVFFKEKEVFMSNLQELQNRNRMNQRKYQAHLNLFHEKLQEKKQESNDLRQILQQYRQDYQNLLQIKTTLQRNLQKESLLWQNKLQLASQRRNDYK